METKTSQEEVKKTFQKVEISKIEISKEIEKIYEYQNRKFEIKTLKNSIKEFGQLQPISVIYRNGKYLIIDGVLRYIAFKNLKLNFIEVIVSETPEMSDDDFTDFVIQNQIKKVKSSKEKVNEVIHTLRIGFEKSNPNRDKEARVQFLADSLGKGWSRSNILTLEKILKWELKNNSLYHISNVVLAGSLSVSKAYFYIKSLERDDYDFEKERESKILKRFFDGLYNEQKVDKLIVDYNTKKNTLPTTIDPSEYSKNNYKVVQGDVLKNPLPKDVFIDLSFTSIPYYGQIKYGDSESEIGWEKTPEEFVSKIVDVYSKNYNQFKDTSVIGINLNETYKDGVCLGIVPLLILEMTKRGFIYIQTTNWFKNDNKPQPKNFKRFGSSFEYILLFGKTKKYYFNPIKIVDENKKCEVRSGCKEQGGKEKSYHISNQYRTVRDFVSQNQMEDVIRLNQSSVRTQNEIDSPFFGSFPNLLPSLFILTLCPENGTVWDPFTGTGTVGRQSLLLGRSFIGHELYEKNIETLLTVLKKGESEFDSKQLNVINLTLGLTESFEEDNQQDMAA